VTSSDAESTNAATSGRPTPAGDGRLDPEGMVLDPSDDDSARAAASLRCFATSEGGGTGAGRSAERDVAVLPFDSVADAGLDDTGFPHGLGVVSCVLRGVVSCLER
jgi:hypothetical protein